MRRVEDVTDDYLDPDLDPDLNDDVSDVPPPIDLSDILGPDDYYDPTKSWQENEGIAHIPFWDPPTPPRTSSKRKTRRRKPPLKPPWYGMSRGQGG
jgi:hypothetical protein